MLRCLNASLTGHVSALAVRDPLNLQGQSFSNVSLWNDVIPSQVAIIDDDQKLVQRQILRCLIVHT
jgi:hypothetical protein